MSGTATDPFDHLDGDKVSREQWRIMFISGTGFFCDAYDLFIIGVVMNILKGEWHPTPFATGLVTSTALLASASAPCCSAGSPTCWGASGSMVTKCSSSRPARSLRQSRRIPGG